MSARPSPVCFPRIHVERLHRSCSRHWCSCWSCCSIAGSWNHSRSDFVPACLWSQRRTLGYHGSTFKASAQSNARVELAETLFRNYPIHRSLPTCDLLRSSYGIGHSQCYLRFKQSRVQPWARKALLDTAHLEYLWSRCVSNSELQLKARMPSNRCGD